MHEEGGTRGRNSDERLNEGHFDAAWQALLDDDGEQLRQEFDACFNPRRCIYPGDHPWGTTVSIEGEIATLSPEAAEARGLLAALEAAGLEPAARQRLEGVVTPRLSEPEWLAIADGRGAPAPRRRGRRRPSARVTPTCCASRACPRISRPAGPCGPRRAG